MVLSYYPPKDSPRFRRFLHFANHHIDGLLGMRYHFDSKSRERLRAIPKNAGNIIVGAHPDRTDGFAIMEVFYQAGRTPKGLLINSEIYEQYKPIIPVLRRMGGMPVNRGDANPKALQTMIDMVSKGGWTGLLPEGSVFWTRQVMPMEYGAAKIAVEAAVKNLAKGDDRPVYITPFSHVYRHQNEKKTRQAMGRELAELEAMPELGGDGLSKTDKKELAARPLNERMVRIAHRLLSHKAAFYGVEMSEADGETIFERGDRLKTRLLESLEKKYMGRTQPGLLDRRRTFKVRAKVFEGFRDATRQDPPDEKRLAALRRDLQLTADVNLMATFSPEYVDKYNDLEMLGEYLRRFRDSMGLEANPFGKRDVYFKVLEPVDIRPYAKRYARLKTEDEKNAFLYNLIEEIRGQVQTGIDALIAEHPSPGF